MIIKNFKIFENLNQAKKIIAINGISQNSKSFIDLRNLLKNNLGYIGWFSKMLYENGVLMSDLVDLYSIINNESEVINGLPRPIIDYDNWEKLIDDIISSRSNIKIKRMYNELPTLQKSFININLKSDRELLLKLYSFEDKKNIFRKISRYKSKKDLISAIKLFMSNKRTNEYSYIKNRIKSNGAKIVYDSHIDDIIICQVDHNQLRYLASDTSWCILNQTTFNGYVHEFSKQYIIFLTDKTDNYSKIGLTYGLRYITSHLKNDSYINFNELNELLLDRGFNIRTLQIKYRDNLDKLEKFSIQKLYDLGIPKEDIIKYKKNLYECSVGELIFLDISKDDIVKNKKTFNKQDIHYFNKDEIIKYGIEDKIEIYSLSKEHDVNFIIKNIFRIKFKISTYDLASLCPSPNQLKDLINLNIFDEQANKIATGILENRYNILDYIKNNYYSFDEKVSLIIYAFKIGGVSERTNDLSEIIECIKPFKLKFHLIYDILEYLESNGFNINDGDQLYNMASNFSHYTFKIKYDDWLELLDNYPCLLDKIGNMIFNTTELNKSIGEISKKSLDIIKKYYPDKYADLFKKINIIKATTNMRNILPDRGIMNYGINRRENIEYMRTNHPDNKSGIIKPNELYNDFYEILKDYEWPSGYDWRDVSITLYMIHALCKINKIDKIGNMKIHWSKSFTGKVIRSALGIYNKNGKTVVYDTFQLNDDEREKLFTYLIMNIKDKVYNDISNIIEDVNMMRHEVFSIIYYIYNWGFNKYMDLVKNTKNVYSEKWTDDKHVKKNKIRIEYLGHIFNYITDIKESVELLDKVMSWDMTKTERKMTMRFICYNIDKNKETLKKILTKYYTIEEIKSFLK